MTSPTLGVLLVAGKLTHQENYGANFRSDSRCKLIAVTDEKGVCPDRERLNRELAKELEIPYLPDLDEALAGEDVDLASVCAEPERRGRIVAKCAAAKKHIYIDKPMTPYLVAADQIVEAVNAADVRTQMLSLIHQPWAQQAKRVLAAGELGELVAIHADCLFAKGPAGTAVLGKPREAHYPPKRFTFVDSKAELYALGVYSIGLVRWLCGREVRTVYGRTANYFFEAHQRNDVEDFGFLALTLDGGLTATITGGRIGWSSHAAAGRSQVCLIGSSGSICVDANRPRLEVFDSEPQWAPPPDHPRDPMAFWQSTQREVNTPPKRRFVPLSTVAPGKTDESHFIDCIIEGRESEMNAANAAALTEILLAGYKSAATGQVVAVPLSRESL